MPGQQVSGWETRVKVDILDVIRASLAMSHAAANCSVGRCARRADWCGVASSVSKSWMNVVNFRKTRENKHRQH